MSGVDVSMNVSVDVDTVPKGLVVWREAVAKSQTAAQLSMGLHMLEASIAWDKSIMKAVSPSLTPTTSVGTSVCMASLTHCVPQSATFFFYYREMPEAFFLGLT